MVNATVQPEFEAEVENIKSEIEISGWENVFENELNEVGLIHPTGKGSSGKAFFRRPIGDSDSECDQSVQKFTANFE